MHQREQGGIEQGAKVVTQLGWDQSIYKVPKVLLLYAWNIILAQLKTFGLAYLASWDLRARLDFCQKHNYVSHAS